ncbi:MAG TPA: hypothetical protein VFE60_17840 [Roseiarcus sp.]|jgi:hypothetical protein|nr:hypothetical protein [Roseiarcus sp.]
MTPRLQLETILKRRESAVTDDMAASTPLRNYPNECGYSSFAEISDSVVGVDLQTYALIGYLIR